MRPPVESGALCQDPTQSRHHYTKRYDAVRKFTEDFCKNLAPEDCVIQSMPDASPTKWHLAHTTWFFETFIVKPAVQNYKSPVPEYAYLFNSYYNAVGKMHQRDQRGMISRPTLEQTQRYRLEVDKAMRKFFASVNEKDWQRYRPLVEIGLNHEQQHQELMITDIKHVFAQNPLYPVFAQAQPTNELTNATPLHWIQFEEGVYWIGHDDREAFHFDNEAPRHRIFLNSFQVATRLVTNKEYIEFIEDDGYSRPELWLSLGWHTVQAMQWNCPYYWEQRENGQWFHYTLNGMRPVDDHTPVTHISYFEADAFARWKGARLPNEAEWEVASQVVSPKQEDNFVEQGFYHPRGLVQTEDPAGLCQMYGNVWEWTRSAYSPYPGYAPVAGALGEYNGKFMCNQYVLKGGSCATSQTHIRNSYRNFFGPEKRWQFTGIRLARDV